MNRRFVELIVLGSCAFLLSQALLSMILEPGASAAEGNPVWRTILSVSYLSVGLILVPYYRETIYVIRRNWPLVLLVILALSSCIWAFQPTLVFRRSLAVFGATLFGLALSLRCSLQDQLRFMSWLFRIVAVLSLICVALAPSYGVFEGEWRGIFQHKNILGSVMALSVLVEWHLPADTPLSRILNRVSLILSLVLLVFSRSVTPAVALVGALMFISIYKVAARRFRVPLYAIVLATFVMIASGLAVLLVDSEKVVGALGKSSDLTGRTEIWSGALSFVREHPLLGYGYWGFWSGASPDSIALERLMGTSIMYSHNGYVEILLTLGFVGFVLTLAFLACGIKRAYNCSRNNPFGVDLWPLAFLLFLILHNVGECTLLVQDLEWSLCVATVISTDHVLFVPIFDENVEQNLATNEGFA